MATGTRTRGLRQGILRIGLALTVVGFVLLDLGLLDASSGQVCALNVSGATVLTPLCVSPTTTTTRPTTTTTGPPTTTTTRPPTTTTTGPPTTTTTTYVSPTITSVPPPATTLPPTLSRSEKGTGILAFTGMAGTLKLVGLALILLGVGLCLVFVARSRSRISE